MLKIRLTRTGKKAQPSFRIVVQEHTSPIKGKFIESLGSYQHAQEPKVFTVDVDRVKYWISVGAQPSDTVASLLKRNGVEGMDKYIGPKKKQGKKKKVVEHTSGASATSASTPSEAPAVEETPAPVAEETPAVEETQAPASEEEPKA